MFTKLCTFCGKEFQKNPNLTPKQWDKQKLCGITCRAAAKVGKPCPKSIRKPLELRFWDHVVTHVDGCWEWLGATHPAGYGLLGRGRTKEGLVRATHVSWKLNTGEDVPKGMMVLHKCDNPPCCNPDHLFLGTHQDNVDDMLKKGRENHSGLYRRYRLENNKGKVSQQQIDEIIEKYQDIPKRRHGRVAFTEALAKEYGLCKSYITKLVRQASQCKKEGNQNVLANRK